MNLVEMVKKAKHEMPHFTEQHRPEKVKEIFNAIKKEHPEMPAEMKARIAESKGSTGPHEHAPKNYKWNGDNYVKKGNDMTKQAAYELGQKVAEERIKEAFNFGGLAQAVKQNWKPLAIGTAGLAGLGGALALGGTQGAQDTYTTRAKTNALQAQNASNLRSGNLANYLFNPRAAGPLSEIASRLSRRQNAAMAEHPYLSSLIPGYGLITGGKAGENYL
jgi:hypothetical protein